MERSDSTYDTPRRRTGSPILKILLGVIVLIVVVILVLPLFINANSFRPTIEGKLSAALNRKVTIGDLSFSLFSGSLVAKNIAIADDPAYSQSPFLQAQSLHVGIHVMPLLLHKDLQITSITLDSPSIQLIQAQNGKWNFSTIGSNSAHNPSQQSGGTPDLSVDELKIENGRASVSSVPGPGHPFVYTDINLGVQHFSFARNFPFQLAANLPGSGTFHLDGTAGPIAQQDASNTPFNATLDLKHFNPVAAGLVSADKGISMNADFHAQLASDGKNLNSNGKIQASQLQLARTGSPAPNPVNVDYQITQDLNARTGQVKDVVLHTGSVAAHLNGSYKMTAEAIDLNLHLSAPNLPVDGLEQLLPAVGVKLPSGSSLHGGTLTASLNITGPATATTIAGPIDVENTKLAGFDLGSKIQGLNALTGTGASTAGGTQIQTVRANVNSTPQVTQFSAITVNVPAIGNATGSGTVTPAGALNFNVVATLNSGNPVGAVANQAVNQVTGMIGGLLHGGGLKPTPASTRSTGIPLTITGTASSPVIRANLRSLLK